MAIAIVQEKAADTAFNGAAAVVTFDSTPTPGNWLVFFFHSTSASASDPPGTVTLAAAADDSSRPTECYIRKVQSGDGVAWSFPSTNITTATNEAHGFEVSGLDSSSPVDKAIVGTASASVTSYQVGSTGTLAQADELVLTCVGLRGTTGGSEAIASPTMTVVGASAHPRTIVGHLIVSATTALDPTVSWTTARNGVGLTVTLRQASAPSTFVPFRLIDSVGGDVELEAYAI